jgi:2-methylcitrate dehydratase PrpD
LVNYVYKTSWDDLPECVVENAKQKIIDFIGITLLGYKRGMHKRILNTLEMYYGKGDSTVIGEGVKLPSMFAALVNSSMCDLFMTDGSRLAGLHPGSVVIPAAFAAAEEIGNISGRDLLLAIVLGYEVMIRVGRAMNPSAVKRGFHLTPVVGPMGSAAAVAKIWNLDQEQITNALSISTIQGCGLIGAFKAEDFFVQIQVARSSEAGIFSTLLAQKGVKGNAEILENSFLPAFSDEYHTNLIQDDIGNSFVMQKTYIKMHGGCRHIHAPIDAVIDVVKKYGVDYREIREVIVKTYSIAFNERIEDPTNIEEAQFSIPFGIAVALVFGDAFPDKFTEQNIKDDRIQKILSKISVELDPELDKEYPSKRGTTVHIATNEGERFSHSLDIARGEPEYPFSRFEVEEKFRRLTSSVIDEETREKIIRFVNRLEAAKNVFDLFMWLKV